MIKKLINQWECPRCGYKFNLIKEIVIDDYIKKIEIIQPKRCACSNRKDFKLLDLELK